MSAAAACTADWRNTDLRLVNSRISNPVASAAARHRPAAVRKRRLGFEGRVRLFAFLAGLPGLFIALILLWTGDFALKTQWTLTLLTTLAWWIFAALLLQRVIHPLRTVSNMLAGLREGDFSLRARGARVDDALGEVLLEVNMLGELLREQRLSALEAAALLRRVMQEIDVALFTFDADDRLRLVNERGQRLLGRSAEQLLGRTAAELSLEECLSGAAPRIVELAVPGGAGRWEIRRSQFRMSGLPHQLLVLSDLTQTLREEERQAWRRLIQVLRHEINNSLAPIDSLAGSLTNLLVREPKPADWDADMREGLTVIRDRSRALNRFMTAYSQLTRLPPPQLKPLAVGDWIRRAAGLELRRTVSIQPGPELTIHADGDQLDQLLINLIRNAVDAVLETPVTTADDGVRVGWRIAADRGSWLEVWIEDDGPGLTNTENLFVPFFTTKPSGAGIGLALSRQIAEGHGGRLTLTNRSGAQGCVATLRLPIPADLCEG